MPAAPQIGDILLVTIDQGVSRPLTVTHAAEMPIYARATPTAADEPLRIELRVSGVLMCEPDDHTRPALRQALATGAGVDPARIHGRPDRLLPLAYAECLAAGTGIGQWRRR